MAISLEKVGKKFFSQKNEGVGRGVEPLEEKSKQKDNYVAQGTQTDCERGQEGDQPRPKEPPHGKGRREQVHVGEDAGNVGEDETCSKWILRKLFLLHAHPEETYGKEHMLPQALERDGCFTARQKSLS